MTLKQLDKPNRHANASLSDYTFEKDGKKWKWHSGKPPMPGWFNASVKCDTRIWRWWDGIRWGCGVMDGLRSQDKLQSIIDSKYGPHPNSSIYWSDYWPRGARTERHWPDGRIDRG